MGTTPARGEEARVVAFQPRGVGLKAPDEPGNDDYTHRTQEDCKSKIVVTRG